MWKTGPLFIFFNISMCGITGIFAADKNDFRVTADYSTKYIWRGQNVNNKGVFEPSVYLSLYGFTAYAWGNLDLTNEHHNRGEFTEIDLIVDYSAAVAGLEGLNFSAGAIHYQFPNTFSRPTTEIYGGLSLNVPLTPSIKVYCDIDETNGCYMQFAIGHIFEKIARFSDDCFCGLQLGSSIGWGNSVYNNNYFNTNEGKFNDLLLSAGFPVCIGRWTVRPAINYSMMLSDAIRSATDKSDNLWGGISVSRSF